MASIGARKETAVITIVIGKIEIGTMIPVETETAVETGAIAARHLAGRARAVARDARVQTMDLTSLRKIAPVEKSVKPRSF